MYVIAAAEMRDRSSGVRNELEIKSSATQPKPLETRQKKERREKKGAEDDSQSLITPFPSLPDQKGLTSPQNMKHKYITPKPN